MSQFDLDSLLQFDPPSHLCEKCFAINQPSLDNDNRDWEPTCSICGVKYLATSDYGRWRVADYLGNEANTGIRFSEPLVHGKKLAKIARYLNAEKCSRSRVEILSDLFLASEQFIHFVSHNISHLFIGALKLVSHRVSVRGIVSNVKDYTVRELLDYPEEAPNFRCLVFDGYDAPHTKMIVVDGLVLLEGSVNLTTNGWRKIEKDRESLKAETNTVNVINDHNRYFSSIWAQRSRIGDCISMISDVPTG
jgi:hypothetical protein